MDKIESKNENLNKKKLNSIQEKTKDELKKLQEQMNSLTEKNEKSKYILTNLQTEVRTVKEDTKTYKQSLGKVKPGKSVSVPEKFALGVCINGIPEKSKICFR